MSTVNLAKLFSHQGNCLNVEIIWCYSFSYLYKDRHIVNHLSLDFLCNKKRLFYLILLYLLTLIKMTEV